MFFTSCLVSWLHFRLGSFSGVKMMVWACSARRLVALLSTSEWLDDWEVVMKLGLAHAHGMVFCCVSVVRVNSRRYDNWFQCTRAGFSVGIHWIHSYFYS